MCYQWKAYLDEVYRKDLFERRDIKCEYSEVVYPFECPECVYVTKLSGLFQHVESNACSQDLHVGKIGKLVRWLEVQHNASGSE